MININMRCIEIVLRTETQDFPNQININMRCIEISKPLHNMRMRDMININMRCIEIIFLYLFRSRLLD